MQHTILSFPEIDSTNSYLKREYRNLPDLTVVTADHQTAGRGRRGRAWEDDYASLPFSLLLKDDERENDASLLPLLTGAAMSDALMELGIKNAIKWPNDILIGDKKAVGILLESVYEEKREAIIIGIGVNVSQESFSGELSDKATSLYLATGKQFDKKSVLDCFLRHFDCCYGMFLKGDDSFLKTVRQRSYLAGKKLYLNYYGEDRHVEALSIASDGSLVVKEGEKIYSLHSGEVTLEKNYH